MTKCIVYFHGFRGSPDSPTKVAIEKAFPNHLSLAFPIDHEAGPAKITPKLTKAIDEIFKTYHPDDVILVGNSAGGFWAYHFAKKHGAAAVLMNPSLHPERNLKKYGLTPQVLKDYHNFGANQGPLDKSLVFVGLKDDVVDPKPTMERFGKRVVKLPNEGHRIQDMKPVINSMKKFMR